MTPVSFGLAVQHLEKAADKVLVVSHVVGTRAGDGWFTPGEVARMFEALRLPAPGGVSQALARLKDADVVMRRSSGGMWSLTPLGHERVRSLIETVDVAAVEAEIARTGGAELEQGQHPTLPPEFAPTRWAVGIDRLLSRFPFDRNVFLMTRFPKGELEGEMPDPVRGVVAAARDALSAHGLHLHLASDRTADDELFGNIAAHMWACKYGIGLFETRYGDDFNDNLQIEVGAMLMTGRRVALLKDVETPDMPTDFVGHIYKSVDFADLTAVSANVHRWVADDLGLGRCPKCPS